MEKSFDVMVWLRGVRDAHYEILKDKTPAERVAWYQEQGARAHAELSATLSGKPAQE